MSVKIEEVTEYGRRLGLEFSRHTFLWTASTFFYRASWTAADTGGETLLRPVTIFPAVKIMFATENLNDIRLGELGGGIANFQVGKNDKLDLRDIYCKIPTPRDFQCW